MAGTLKKWVGGWKGIREGSEIVHACNYWL